jgi:hypothetical protein
MQLLSRLLAYLNLTRVTKSEAIVVTTPRLSGRWKRVIDEDDAVLGYEFTCLCGQQNKYRPTEALVDQVHRCSCGRDFNLKQSLILTGAATKLVKRAASQQPLIRTIGEENVPIYWSGKTDTARDRGFDAGDPGYTNLF